MIKRIIVGLVVGALALTGLSACGTKSNATGSDEDYYGICVDPNTQVRLPDNECADAELDSAEDYEEAQDEGFSDGLVTAAVLWFVFANSSTRYPAVGQAVTSSSGVRTSLPKGAKYRGTGLNYAGGQVTPIKKTTTSKSKSSKSKSRSGSSKSRSSGGFKRR